MSRLLLLALLSACAFAARAEPLGCLIEPDRVAEVGSPGLGVLGEVRVERGDFVQAGQVLATLSAEVERATVAVARSRAEAQAELRGAEAAADLARGKMQRTRDLQGQRFVSAQALEQAEAEWRVAEERLRQARESKEVASRQLQLSAAQLGQRSIRSPFAGVVVERWRNQGERVEREPIARIAKIDPLRVEVIVPAARFGSIQPGQTAAVTPQLPQFGVLKATVTVVDRVLDAASNSFRVRLALPNPEHRVPAGLRCSVDFGGDGARSAPLPAPLPESVPGRRTAPQRPGT